MTEESQSLRQIRAATTGIRATLVSGTEVRHGASALANLDKGNILRVHAVRRRGTLQCLDKTLVSRCALRKSHECSLITRLDHTSVLSEPSRRRIARHADQQLLQ